MELKHKSFDAPDVKTIDAAQGIMEAYVAVFNNIDAAKERIIPGAFAKSLARGLPKGVWMHDWKDPVAKTLEAEEVAPFDPRLPTSLKNLGGLRIKAQFNLETQRGKEAFSDLSFGTVDQFSFGYTTERAEHNAKSGCTDLKELTAYEWSPVLVGCNPATTLVGLKAEEPEAPAPEPEQISDASPAGGTFEEQLDSALAAVKGCTGRIAEVAALRAKKGGNFSAARREQMKGLRDAPDTLLLETQPGPTVAELRLKHRERTARLLA